MDSIIFQANVLGMLAYVIPALILFLRIIRDVEDKLIERKLYLACGIGVVIGTFAAIVMILGGINFYSDEIGYASMILVSPFVMMVFLFIGVNLNTFKSEYAAPYYSTGFGLFFGGSLEFWRLQIAEERYDLEIIDALFIATFGFGTILFLGGAATWISYGIKKDEGPRIAARLTFLYLFLAFLYASALENIHYNVHDSILITIAALIGYLVVSATLFHQAFLRLPKITKKD